MPNNKSESGRYLADYLNENGDLDYGKLSGDFNIGEVSSEEWLLIHSQMTDLFAQQIGDTFAPDNQYKSFSGFLINLISSFKR